MSKTTIFILLFPIVIAFSVRRFFRGLPSKCPSADHLQSPFVKESFNQSKMDGFWYELAMKDCTQPRMCSCQTSNKQNDGDTLHDEFSLECAGDTYFANLTFALQPTPGVLHATWNSIIPLVDRIIWPNMVVDVEEDDEGNYEWMIEFQCIQGRSFFGVEWIAFYAFNFYSRRYNVPGRVNIMEARARERGLGPFIDHWKPMAIIDHSSDCLYGH
jgi:hypothetical protein